MEDQSADPLGARDSIVQLESLTRWNLTLLPMASEDEDGQAEEEELDKSPFPWRNDLNNKIILWKGDVTELNVHAIVHSTNEKMNEKNPLMIKLHAKAGPKLEDEIKNNIRVCKTGEAKISEGFGLLCRHVIHTVGPRYNVKYITAAEGALFSSYRSTLQLVRENSIRTLGLCCVHSTSRGYPPNEGAHIAIITLLVHNLIIVIPSIWKDIREVITHGTVRRFLERYGSDLDTVVFVCEDETYDSYQSILPLYFPRSPQEERDSVAHLPKDIGNEIGEPIIPERQIRIIDKPTMVSGPNEDFDKTVDLNAAFGESINGCVGQHPFANMEDNPDLHKHIGPRNTLEQRLIEQHKRYERLLKRARTEDLTDIASLRCLYRSGHDRFGRQIVVFVGKNFPANIIDLEKALLYMIRLMDPIVEKDYVIVYFHTETTNANFPPMNYLKNVYQTLIQKYKKNLKAFYIIHPTWWSKLATWFFTTFTASAVKTKVHSLKGVQFLYTKMNPDQLDIPPFVLDYDIRVNGPRYCVPFEDEVVEEL